MNVKKSISPLKVNEYGSTKICNSESISPIKLCKNTKKSVLSAKDFSDVSSDSELSVISSVSSNSLSSHRRNNLQSDNIIYDEESRFGKIDLQNLKPIQRLIKPKICIENSKLSSIKFLNISSMNGSSERKVKAEGYLKDLGNYLFSLRSKPSDDIKPLTLSKSPEVRRESRGIHCKMRRNTTRTDLSNINWKQLSSNLIELEKELDSKYPNPNYAQTFDRKSSENSNTNSKCSQSINNEKNKDKCCNQIQLFRVNSNGPNSDSSNDCEENFNQNKDQNIFDEKFTSNNKFQKESFKTKKNLKFISMKNISIDSEFKDRKSDSESKERIINLQYIKCDESESVNKIQSQLEFIKRKRIMSNIDNNIGVKKKVSPKK